MDDRSTAISAAEVADDGAEIAAAVKVAKAFRDKLEAAGISYHKLLALEEARRDMNDLAHHILLGWESVDNRPLYNRYRHTKKKRIRKKYAKRILEWYRTEVAPC